MQCCQWFQPVNKMNIFHQTWFTNILSFQFVSYSLLYLWKHMQTHRIIVMVPINLTCPHCLQHFFFEHLFHLYSPAWFPFIYCLFVLNNFCDLLRAYFEWNRKTKLFITHMGSISKYFLCYGLLYISWDPANIMYDEYIINVNTFQKYIYRQTQHVDSGELYH